MNKVDKFLEELAELSKKYNMHISGCCASPEILEGNDEYEVLGDRLLWDEESQTYGIENFKEQFNTTLEENPNLFN